MDNRGKLIEERGGRCQHCGYWEHPLILRFVQISPIIGERRSLGKIISDGAEDKARAASHHAILVCPTCHEVYKAGYFEITFKPSAPPKIFTAAEVVEEEPIKPDVEMNEYRDYEPLGVANSGMRIPEATDWERIWVSASGNQEAWASDSLEKWYKVDCS